MKRFVLRLVLCTGFVVSVPALWVRADSGYDAWLRFTRLDARAARTYQTIPVNVVVVGHSIILETAQKELTNGLNQMLDRSLHAEVGQLRAESFLVGTSQDLKSAFPEVQLDDVQLDDHLAQDSFSLTRAQIHGFSCVIIAGATDRGVLYGVFALLSKIARNESIADLHERQEAYARIRWVDQWDNLDGRIERGYAGRSIFFENGAVRGDLTRVRDYARLLASIGVNGCNVNNVNADPRALTDQVLLQLRRIADIFRPWGIRLSVSVDLGSPKTIGGLQTFDPLDPRVANWWQKKVDQIYDQIPDFAGFVVKADSEGQVGPSSYGRTPADAANTIAHALAPHGGILFYRAFVYNHHLDWRDPKNDRARAAYDIFHPLDGKFESNVVIQIKYGPIDFQAREPVSPLFSGLEKTNEAMELQITQEYTGQQRHLCFLAPMWKQILDFDLHAGRAGTLVKDLISGHTFPHASEGFVGVANVGLDSNWLAHPLAMANLYAFGRLAWNPNLSPDTIAEEWTRLTFGNDPVVVQTISRLQLASWPAYESYTGPLGAQTLTDILGSHYGPGIESSERNGWGQWHRADGKGIGMDRSVATGTGYVGQYRPPVAARYESLETTPDELLLFFHHVPYTFRLHSGKTVIQHIYDSHYEGAEEAEDFVREWTSLKGRMDDERYADVLARLEYQAGHAIVWRDAICDWFFRASGIPDAQGRVGQHPDRIEAEAMQLQGYVSVDVTPWENASGGKAVECTQQAGCSASFSFANKSGFYDLDVEYFDLAGGASEFRMFVGEKLVDEWKADAHLPFAKLGGDSSTRHRIRRVELHTGDVIRLEGISDGEERAPLDYIEIHPEP
jgi:alpha-glucuronidase